MNAGLRILSVFLLITVLAAPVLAGTEYLSKGHYMLGLGAHSDFISVHLSEPYDSAGVTLEPEFGYFLFGRFAVITALAYSGIYSFEYDEYYSHLQWLGGVEVDPAVNDWFAFYFRFTGGLDYDPEGGDDQQSAKHAPSVAQALVIPDQHRRHGFGACIRPQ